LLYFQVIALSVIVGLIRRGRVQRLIDININQFWLVLVPAALLLVSYQIRAHASPHFYSHASPVLSLLIDVVFIAFFLFNIKLPGMKWFVAGWVLNVVPIVTNGFKMPVLKWATVVARCELSKADLSRHEFLRHVMMNDQTRFKFLSDIIPITRPPFITAQVVSVGDVLIAVGLFILVQMTMCPGKSAAASGETSGK
jgi:hypothetical protein